MWRLHHGAQSPPPTQPLGSGFVSEVHLFSRLGSAKDGRVGIGDLVERLRDGSRLQLQPGPLCSLLCKQTDVTTSVQAGIEQAARTRVRTEMSLAPPQVEKRKRKDWIHSTGSDVTFRGFPKVCCPPTGRGSFSEPSHSYASPPSVAGTTAAAASTPPTHVVVIPETCRHTGERGQWADWHPLLQRAGRPRLTRPR